VSIDIFDAIVDFYGLQCLQAVAVPNVDAFSPSQNRWLRDFESYQATYQHKLARAIYDYLALICFGEARHAKNRASHYVDGLPTCSERSTQYDRAAQYNPQQFLPVLEELFNIATWESGYGGTSWARIARAAQMYGTVPDAVFIDHCVDLSHNNSLCFNKEEADIFTLRWAAGYKTMLDRKARWAPTSFIDEYVNNFSYAMYSLLVRAQRLGLINNNIPQIEITNDADEWEYEPIKWGSREVGGIIQQGETCYVCGETVLPNQAYEVQGETVCSYCYRDLGYCDYCEEVVLGDVTYVDGHGYVCDDCLPEVEKEKEEEENNAEEEEEDFEYETVDVDEGRV